jgi:signal peptidase I
VKPGAERRTAGIATGILRARGNDAGESGERLRRAGRVSRALGCVFALLLALVVSRTFVADVYRINSGSMRPTLMGGAASGGKTFTEWVLVRYDRAPELARYDLVVVESREGGDAVVKRVVGLPGEELRISGGDLFVKAARDHGARGERPALDAARPAPVPVFDDRWQDPEAFFYYARETRVWRLEERTWILDGRAIPPGRSEGMASFDPPLRDGYLDPSGERVDGLVEVNDAVLECEFALDSLAPSGALRFRLIEEGDTFELRVSALAERWRVELVRRNRVTLEATERASREEILASSEARLDRERFHRLAFSNVDNQLAAEIAGVCTLRASYEENVPSLVATAPGQSVGPRVSFGGEGIEARFRAVRILRDLYYTSSGTFGVEAPVFLGPDEIFVLGDNSTASQDSRHFGSVPLGDVLGRPVLVVWPPGRMRRP